MRKVVLSMAAGLLVVVLGVFGTGTALADGPSGSTECSVQDDDCDGTINEDTGTLADDNDGDGAFDEDGPDGVDNDGDLLIDEDPADDDGDGLIDEDPPGDVPGGNEVTCADGENVGDLFFLYASDVNGVEVCADDASGLPADGRVIVTNEQGGYVAADGDASNGAPLDGYLRLDGAGVHCGDNVNSDSTAADQSGNTIEDCGP